MLLLKQWQSDLSRLDQGHGLCLLGGLLEHHKSQAVFVWPVTGSPPAIHAGPGAVCVLVADHLAPSCSVECVRLAVSELRGELATHQTEIRGDLRELQAKSAGKLTVWGSALTLFVGLAALTATLFAFGAQMFDVGAGRAEANSAIARETAQQVLTLQAAEELRESKARRGR